MRQETLTSYFVGPERRTSPISRIFRERGVSRLSRSLWQRACMHVSLLWSCGMPTFFERENSFLPLILLKIHPFHGERGRGLGCGNSQASRNSCLTKDTLSFHLGSLEIWIFFFSATFNNILKNLIILLHYFHVAGKYSANSRECSKNPLSLLMNPLRKQGRRKCSTIEKLKFRQGLKGVFWSL